MYTQFGRVRAKHNRAALRCQRAEVEMAERHADANNRINCQISERRQGEDGALLGESGEGEHSRKKRKRKKNPTDGYPAILNNLGAAVPCGATRGC